MSRLASLTPATAVGASKDLLAELVNRHGQVGDMVAAMAHSPAVLGGYLQLSTGNEASETQPMIDLGLRVYREPASISDEHIAGLRAYGYGDREIADVVGIVALNVLTGAFNLVAGVKPDEPDR